MEECIEILTGTGSWPVLSSLDMERKCSSWFTHRKAVPTMNHEQTTQTNESRSISRNVTPRDPTHWPQASDASIAV
jgi:hypothetical protein